VRNLLFGTELSVEKKTMTGISLNHRSTASHKLIEDGKEESLVGIGFLFVADFLFFIVATEWTSPSCCLDVGCPTDGELAWFGSWSCLRGALLAGFFAI
jgi:hypothetical protein